MTFVLPNRPREEEEEEEEVEKSKSKGKEGGRGDISESFSFTRLLWTVTYSSQHVLPGCLIILYKVTTSTNMYTVKNDTSKLS